MTREIRLGLFIVGALLILTAGVFLIGEKSSLFKRTFAVRSDFDTAAGLVSGAEVRVGGIHEGTVKRIQLPDRPDQKVTVFMQLEDSARPVVKKDSVAAIKSDGLLGDKYVEVSFGSNGAAPLQNGDSIPSQPPLDVSDLIKKTDQILDSTKASLKNVETTSGNLEAITSKIQQGKGTVGELINDPSVYREANKGATAFAENMEALKHNFFLRGFFKKRGYEDSDELTKHAVQQLPAAEPSQTFVWDARKLFNKPDGAKLKHSKPLTEAGEFLQDNKYGLAVVVAQGGAVGDSEKLRTLTEAQSMVVRDYLVQHFKIDDTHLKNIGLGKAKDAADAGKVELAVYGAETPGTPQASATAKK